MRFAAAALAMAFASLAVHGQGLREVPFQFVNGKARLKGTLVLPASQPPYPAMAMLHDAGPESREVNYGMARRFAQSGVAALVYDQRGVGESTGSWRTAGPGDLAQDAAVAVAFFRGRPDIRADRIGLYGRGQGAALLPLAAEKAGHIAFLIGADPQAASLDGRWNKVKAPVLMLFSSDERAGSMASRPGLEVCVNARVDDVIGWTSRVVKGDAMPEKGLSAACRKD